MIKYYFPSLYSVSSDSSIALLELLLEAETIFCATIDLNLIFQKIRQ